MFVAIRNNNFVNIFVKKQYNNKKFIVVLIYIKKIKNNKKLKINFFLLSRIV